MQPSSSTTPALSEVIGREPNEPFQYVFPCRRQSLWHAREPQRRANPGGCKVVPATCITVLWHIVDIVMYLLDKVQYRP